MTRRRLLVLASGSPRRRVLLRREGFDFTVLRPDIDERPADHEAPTEMVARLSEMKATAGSAGSTPAAVVLGADTTVVRNGKALGKPRDSQEAVEMLLSLSDRSHEAVTGYALAVEGRVVDSGIESTTVVFGALDVDDAVAYAATGEPVDKAGGYAIQGLGRQFVKEISGSFTNVMGLPMEAIVPLLAKHGVNPTTGN